jgi:hypothetical protein
VAWLATSIVLVLLLLAGCGGDHGGNGNAKGSERSTAAERGGGEKGGEAGEEEGGEAGERERALKGIPHADRVAFFQLGNAIGDLSTTASVVSVKGLVRRHDTLALRRLQSSVRSLRPRNGQLRRLRRQVLLALKQAVRARRTAPIARRSAPKLLARSNTLFKRLQLYVKSHPGIGALVPE